MNTTTAERSVLIWDRPTRLFHWLLALGCAAALTIALGFGEHSAAFPYHALIGLALIPVLLLRLGEGLWGSRHAQFRAWPLAPGEALTYLQGALTGGARRYVGHNPGAAYAALAMLVLVAGLALTGLLLGQGLDSVEDLHEWLAYALLATIAAHLLGLVLHTLRHRENIARSMVDGQRLAAPEQGLASTRTVPALVYLVVIGAWGLSVIDHYQPATQSLRLPVLGLPLQIGEVESGVGHHDDDDDNDD
jgi:cytochrome b